MALTDKQAKNRLNSAPCFETEHEIMVPKPHQHKAHLRPIKKIKHMSWISQRQKQLPAKNIVKMSLFIMASASGGIILWNGY